MYGSFLCTVAKVTLHFRIPSMLLFIKCFIGIIKYVDTVSNRPLPLRAALAMLEANLAKNKLDKITCCLLFESCKKMLSSESCKDE